MPRAGAGSGPVQSRRVVCAAHVDAAGYDVAKYSTWGNWLKSASWVQIVAS